MARCAGYFFERHIKEMDFNPPADSPSFAGTICLVDDDPSMLKALDRLLLSVGFQPQVFDDPLDFLSYASCHSVALAVLDIWMPGMSGLATQQKLETVSPHTRVIIITANDDYSVRNVAIQGGAIGFFVKPFDDEVFLAAVHQALAFET